MKKSLSFCFTIITVCIATSQNLNIARHVEYKIIPSNMVSINSKSYYLETTGLSYIAGIDNNGQNLFRVLTDNIYNGARNVVKIIRTNDSKLVGIVHSVGSCDVFDTPYTVMIKCDTLGSINFSVSIPRQIRDITQHPDGSYYMAHRYDANLGVANSGPNILHYSAAGASLNAVASSFTLVNSIFALPNGNLLINGVENGVLKNVEMSTSGTVINSTNAFLYINGFKLSNNGTLYGLASNGSIQSYSTNLASLNNSAQAVLPNIKITDFNLRNDSIFCTGYDSVFQKPYYALLGSNLNLLYQTLAPYNNIFPTGISVNNLNHVSMVSCGNSTVNTQMKHFGLYQTSTTGSFVSKYDAGVVGYSVLSSTFQGMNYAYFSYYATAQLEVQVKNFGADPVTGFYLNYEGFIGCAYPYHQKFNVTIAPNSVVTVTTNVLSIKLPNSAYTPTAPPRSTYSGNICISTSVPNSENDIAADNDGWCKLLVFEPVGINELLQTDNSVSIFPNPAQNYFTVTTDNIIKKIEISSVTGELIHTEPADKKDLKIETDNWPQGIYFLRLETDKGTCVKKIIKD